LAPRARFELATLRLTAECSTVELPGNWGPDFANCSTLQGNFLNRNDADIRTFRTEYGQIETEFGVFRTLFAVLDSLRHLAAAIRDRLRLDRAALVSHIHAIWLIHDRELIRELEADCLDSGPPLTQSIETTAGPAPQLSAAASHKISTEEPWVKSFAWT
jgi:hypothetical protein